MYSTLKIGTRFSELRGRF